MTTLTPPLVALPMRRSPHEVTILRAIGEGAGIDALLQCPKWTIDDVYQTMQRFELTVTEDGRLVRKPGVRHDLMHLAHHSPSEHVRQAAGATVEQLHRLRVALDEHVRELAREAEKARQRRALELWRAWLKTAAREAAVELRRLRPRPTKEPM
jgi:hypothetical protein